jgi:hypothetical protein
LTVAFAISIAVHEVAAGAIAPNRPQAAAREIVSSVRAVRITLRPPQARAEPVPQRTVTPPSPLPAPQTHARLAAHFAKTALPRTAHVLGAERGSARNARPVWDAPAVVAASGRAASASGRAAAASGAGTNAENGNAAQSTDQPCGFVTFSDPHGSHYDAQTRGFWVDIRMSVHLADGSSQSLILDYPWYYPSEAANPWSDQNLKDPAFPTRLQTPPPGKIGSEPPLVQYVLAHSTPDGMTLLRDCPEPKSTPAA